MSQNTICPPTITAVVEHDKGKSATFTLEPLMAGYGRTLANSLRRVLLSSISGAAVISFRIHGVDHEFTNIAGVKEDALEVKLNIMGLRFTFLDQDQDQPVVVKIKKTKSGPVTGADVETGGLVEVINPDHLIASLDGNKTLEIEIKVASGRGYLTIEASDKLQADKPAGFIVVDAHFCPVRRVRYKIDNTRVGQMTDLDRISLTIDTDGAMAPQAALEEAAAILQTHYAALSGTTTVETDSFANVASSGPADDELDPAGIDSRLLEEISNLDISNRAINALLTAGHTQIKDVINLSDSELKQIPGLGTKGIGQLKDKIKELGFEI